MNSHVLLARVGDGSDGASAVVLAFSKALADSDVSPSPARKNPDAAFASPARRYGSGEGVNTVPRPLYGASSGPPSLSNGLDGVVPPLTDRAAVGYSRGRTSLSLLPLVEYRSSSLPSRTSSCTRKRQRDDSVYCGSDHAANTLPASPSRPPPIGLPPYPLDFTTLCRDGTAAFHGDVIDVDDSDCIGDSSNDCWSTLVTTTVGGGGPGSGTVTFNRFLAF